MTDLHHLRILVTRPYPQGEKLCEEIARRGGEPIYLPTIAFAPPPHDIKPALQTLHQHEWLIFISPQSVYALTSIMQLPTNVKLAAVGKGTADALHQAGFENIIYPDTFNSEALLDLPVFQNVSGKKIAIIRGAGGREYIDKTLAERGAIISPVIVYKRIVPDVDVTDCLQRLEQHAIDMIVCTSFESVQNLKILLGDAAWKYLPDIPLIVMSERIKRLAEDSGFRRIWVTRHVSDKALLDVMAEIKEKAS